MATSDTSEPAGQPGRSSASEFVTKPEESEQSLMDRAYTALNSPLFTVIVLFMTLYLLFGSDAKLLTTTQRNDEGFVAVSSICFFFLLGELLARLVVETEISIVTIDDPSTATDGSVERSIEVSRDGYLWSRVQTRLFGAGRRVKVRGYAFSFMFWLDLISLASIVPEIPWMITAVAGEADEETSNNLSTARASRVSRVGSKLGRIIRMVRLVRLMQLATAWYRLKLSVSAANSSAPPSARWQAALNQQSQMGARLHSAITGGVIFLVLLLLLVLPTLTGTSKDFALEATANSVFSMALWRGAAWQTSVIALLSTVYTWKGDMGVLPDDLGTPHLVYASVSPGPAGQAAWVIVDRPDIYRDARVGLAASILGGTELITYDITGPVDPATGVRVETHLSFYERPHVRASSALTIGLTCVVIGVLAVGAMQLSSDAQGLVLRPIESMIFFLHKASMDPLGRISSRDNTGLYETKVLENTIKKIGALLTVAFGRESALVLGKHLDPASRDAHRRGQAEAMSPRASRAGKHGSSIASLKGQPSVGNLSVMNAGKPSFLRAPALKRVDTASSGMGASSRFGMIAAQGPVAAAGAVILEKLRYKRSPFCSFVPGTSMSGSIICLRLAHDDALADALGPARTVWRNKVLKIIHDRMAAAGAMFLSSNGDELLFAIAAIKELVLSEPTSTRGHTASPHTPAVSGEQQKVRRNRRASLGAVITGIDAGASVAAAPAPGASSASKKVESGTAAFVRRASAGVSLQTLQGSGTQARASAAAAAAALSAAAEGDGLWRTRQGVVDMSVWTCMKILADLRRSLDVMSNAEMRAVRDMAYPALAGYRPRLEIGIHYGRAVECAVGTPYRVGVSLLGDAVGRAQALSELAPHYGAELLISPEAVRYMTASWRDMVRRLHDDALGPVYCLDCWDWSASVPPDVARAALSTRVLPHAASDIHSMTGRKYAASEGKLHLAPAMTLPDVPNWANASVLASGYLNLLPFGVLASSAHLHGHAADLLSTALVKIDDQRRAVSIVGASDIVEHAGVRVHAPDASATERDPDVWALRAVFRSRWQATSNAADSCMSIGALLPIARLLRSSATLGSDDADALSEGVSSRDVDDPEQEAEKRQPLTGLALDLPSRSVLARLESVRQRASSM